MFLRVAARPAAFVTVSSCPRVQTTIFVGSSSRFIAFHIFLAREWTMIMMTKTGSKEKKRFLPFWPASSRADRAVCVLEGQAKVPAAFASPSSSNHILQRRFNGNILLMLLDLSFSTSVHEKKPTSTTEPAWCTQTHRKDFIWEGMGVWIWPSSTTGVLVRVIFCNQWERHHERDIENQQRAIILAYGFYGCPTSLYQR